MRNDECRLLRHPAHLRQLEEGSTPVRDLGLQNKRVRDDWIIRREIEPASVDQGALKAACVRSAQPEFGESSRAESAEDDRLVVAAQPEARNPAPCQALDVDSKHNQIGAPDAYLNLVQHDERSRSRKKVPSGVRRGLRQSPLMGRHAHCGLGAPVG